MKFEKGIEDGTCLTAVERPLHVFAPLERNPYCLLLVSLLPCMSAAFSMWCACNVVFSVFCDDVMFWWEG